MGVRASKPGKLIGARVVKRRGGPPLAPRGYVPICVGVNDDTRRFIVHRTALGDAEFTELLCKSAEEYGFSNQGVLRILHEAKDFEEWMIRKSKLRVARVNPVLIQSHHVKAWKNSNWVCKIKPIECKSLATGSWR
ncbi:uncharacterized protein LOC110625944 [Manihot esculenta]|uniref:Auxin-responsive protein n=1 Tax=Manihot esculenta TaxID=3983 RepID=A0A2C9UXK8_MANES|nr:uncharacterized protein LOC110625944 [Manihot esculenta]OAY36354.1 hypothetical protein MANES_11G015000v8 [Manihot esculenta]